MHCDYATWTCEDDLYAPSTSPTASSFTPANRTELLAALTAWDADPTLVATHGAVGTWNVTAINDFAALLSGLTNFDENLSGWDTMRVTQMPQTFNGATVFNNGGTSLRRRLASGSLPLAFDTGSVTDMANIFDTAIAFDQPLPFDTRRVTRIDVSFRGATAFNQPLFFDTGAVTTLGNCFNNAASFNQPLYFDTGQVSILREMFRSAASFNQSLAFDVSSVADMEEMLDGTTALSDCNKRLIHTALSASTAWPADYVSWALLCGGTLSPSASPSVSPSAAPSASPSASPSVSPGASPSASPSATPSVSPTAAPSNAPLHYCLKVRTGIGPTDKGDLHLEVDFGLGYQTVFNAFSDVNTIVYDSCVVSIRFEQNPSICARGTKHAARSAHSFDSRLRRPRTLWVHECRVRVLMLGLAPSNIRRSESTGTRAYEYPVQRLGPSRPRIPPAGRWRDGVPARVPLVHRHHQRHLPRRRR
jgi:hypothetical protein